MRFEKQKNTYMEFKKDDPRNEITAVALPCSIYLLGIWLLVEQYGKLFAYMLPVA